MLYTLLLFICALFVPFHTAHPAATASIAEAAATGHVATRVQEKPAQDKALKYHKALRKRPATGYLFDRFYDTWLDTSSLKQLEEFLAEQIEQSKATNDRLLLAFFYAKQGEDVKSLQQFRKALETDPGNANVWYEKALVEARTLDFETALKNLDKAAQAKPKQETANKIAQLQGKLYVRNRQNDKAIAVWKKLIDDNPQDGHLIEDVIELQISEGLFEEAVKLSDNLIKTTKDPYKKVMRQLRKGDIIQRSGKRKEALEIYDATLKQVGNDTWLEREILAQIDNVFRREDDLTGLNAHFKKLIGENAKRLALRKATAKLQVELGMMEEAVAAYKEIVDLTPGDRGNREAYIDMLAEADNVTVAIKQTELLIKQFSDDAELRLKLAKLHHQAGTEDRSDKVAAAIDQFIKVSEDSEYAFLRAARMYERYEDKDRAGSTFERCIEKFPESDTARESYADHLYKNKKKEQAIAIWKSQAEKSDRGNLIRIARQLSGRQEHQVAFDLLFKRFDDFKLNSPYLGQLCTEAIALKKVSDAIPWVLQRVRLSKTDLELNTCIGQAIQVVSKSDDIVKIIADLRADANRKVSSTCLLAELLELEEPGKSSDKLLADAVQKLTDTPLPENKQQQEALQMLASQQVRLFVNRQDWGAAAKAAKRRVEMPGGRKANNLQHLVELYLRGGKLEKSLPWIAEWKKVSPGSLMPWFNESSILSRLGKLDESINSLRLAAQKFPKDMDLHSRLGDRYIENGQYADAERVYWRQYEESEKLTDKLRWAEQLADVAEDTGETEELITRFQERHRSNPQSVEPLLALAQVHRIADNYEERRKALLEATRLQTDNLPLMLEIARLEEIEGDWEKAIETLQKAAKLDKSDRTKEKMALIYMQYGEVERGYGMLVEIAGGLKSDARAVEKIADAIIGAEDWELAKDFMQQHVVRFPDDYRIQYLMAVIEEELEFFDPAKDTFVKLLSNQKEIEGLGLKATPGASGPSIVSILPPAAVELSSLTSASFQAYSYREEYRNYYFSSSSSSTKTIQLPNSVDLCRQMAIVHLRSMASEMEKADRKALATDMKIAGVANSTLLTETTADIQSMFRGNSSLLEDYPDNESVLALSVFSSAYSSTIAAETAAKAHETFKDSYPELAFMAAIHAAGQDKKYHDLLDTELAGEKLKFKPSSYSILAMARFLSKSGASLGVAAPDTNELSKDQISKLNKKLLELYPELRSNSASGMNQWIFRMVAAAIASDSSPEPFINFLDDEIIHSRKKRTTRSRSRYSYGGMVRSDNVANLISLPPQSFVSFPPDIAALVKVSQSNDYDPLGGGEGILDLDKWSGKFQSAIDKAKDPTLRILLQLRLVEHDPAFLSLAEDKQYESVQKLIDSALAGENQNPDHYLLAAGLASKLEQWQRASELLEKLRNFPLNRETRKYVDSALIAVATEGISGQLDAPENAKVLASAKSAALRLRRARLPAEKRLILVGVLETLGLTEEAEKMEDKIVNAGQSSSGAMGGFSFGVPSHGGGGNKRIRGLIDAGNTDAAVRLLVTEFKGHASNVMNLNSMSYGQDSASELARRIKSLGVTDEFLKKVDPGESTSRTKLTQHAYALELFDKKDAAMEAYKKLLGSAGKKKDAVRLRLMKLELIKGLEVDHHFASFDPTAMPQVGSALVQLLHENSIKTDNKFKLLESARKFAETQTSASNDMSWLVPLTGWLSESVQIRRNQPIHSLFAILTTKQREKILNDERKKEKYEALDKRRAEFHRQYCETLFKIPQLGPAAFSALLRADEASGKELDSYGSLAVKALVQFKEPKKSRRGNANSLRSHMMQMQYFSGRWMNSGNTDHKEAPIRTPMEFLARHFGTKNADERNEGLEKVYKSLSDAEKTEQVDKLKQMVQLYSAPDEDFIEIAQQYVVDRTKAEKRNQSFDPNQPLLKVIEVWQDTRPQLSLDELVLEHATKPASQRNPYGSDTSYLNNYLSKLAANNETDRIKNFIETYSVHWLGPREEQAEIFKNQSGRNIQRLSTKKRMGYQQYSQFLSGMLQDEKLVLYAILEGQAAGYSQIAVQGGYQLSERLSSFTDATELLQWLDASSFLKDLAEFEPIAFDAQGSQGTVWSSALERLTYSTPPWQESLKKHFAAKEKAKDKLTFGEEILLMMVDGRSIKGPKGPYTLIGKRLGEFKALPAERQKSIAMFTQELSKMSEFQNESNAVSFNENGKAAKAIVRELLSASASKNLEKLLAAKRISDLSIDEYEFGDWAKRTIGLMDRKDSKKWLTAFNKAAALGAKSSNQMFYSGEGESQATQLLDNLMEEDTDYQWFVLVHDLLQQDEAIDVAIGRSTISRMAEFLSQTRGKLAGKKAKKGSKKSKRKSDAAGAEIKELDALYRDMGPRFKDLDTAALLPVFQNLFYQQEMKDIDKAIEWAKMESENGRFKSLARTLSLSLGVANASKIYMEQRKAAGKDAPLSAPKRLEKPADYQVGIFELLDGDELKMPAKIGIAVNLISMDYTLPAEGVWKCSDLFAKAYDQKLEIPQNAETAILYSMNSVATDPKYKEKAALFAKAWLGKLNRKRRNQGHSHYWYSSDSDSARPAIEAIKMLSKLNQRSKVDSVLRHYSESASTRATIAALIENDFHSLAKRGYQQITSSPGKLDIYDDKARFNKRLEKSLPEFVKLFGNDASKLAAETFFASAKNSRVIKSTPSTTKDQRLNKLAAKYPDLTFKSKSQNQITVMLLSQGSEAGQFVGKPLEEFAGKLKTVDLWDPNGSNEFQFNRSLLGTWLGRCMELGNTETVISTLDTLLLEKPEENDWQFNNMIESVMSRLGEPIMKQVTKSSPEELEELLPLLKKLSDPDYVEYASDIPTTTALAHVLAGKEDEFSKWVKSFERPEGLSKDEEYEPFSGADLDETWPMLFKFYKDRDEFKSIDGKVKMVHSFWKLASESGFTIGSGHFVEGVQESCSGCRDTMMGLDAIKDAKILTGKEIAEYGPKLAEINSISGEIWRQVAKEQLELNQLEAAATSMKASLDGAKKDMKQAKSNRTVEYANILAKLGQADKVKKLLKDVNDSLLLGDNVHRYASLEAVYGDAQTDDKDVSADNEDTQPKKK